MEGDDPIIQAVVQCGASVLYDNKAALSTLKAVDLDHVNDLRNTQLARCVAFRGFLYSKTRHMVDFPSFTSLERKILLSTTSFLKISLHLPAEYSSNLILIQKRCFRQWTRRWRCPTYHLTEELIGNFISTAEESLPGLFLLSELQKWTSRECDFRLNFDKKMIII